MNFPWPEPSIEAFCRSIMGKLPEGVDFNARRDGSLILPQWRLSLSKGLGSTMKYREVLVDASKLGLAGVGEQNATVEYLLSQIHLLEAYFFGMDAPKSFRKLLRRRVR